MGDVSFQNNVPDPLLSGKELPRFKFKLEKSKGKVLANNFGKIAGNLVDVLATNFGKPESLIRAFPRKDVFIAPSE
jgi:hypothetical protein